MNRIKYLVMLFIEILISPFIYPFILWLRFGRITNFKYQSITNYFLKKIGVLPIIDHYYEPLINPSHIFKPLNDDRKLLGLKFGLENQIALLNQFSFQKELLELPKDNYGNRFSFAYNNLSYPSGDAELYYSMLRLKKPKNIIEIGSGQSTLLALEAIRINKKEDPSYDCRMICIEPYEYNWLEELGVEVIRKRVERLNFDLFNILGENDFLFIDSSHVIRPQGDVLFEIQELLPLLSSGVFIHFHDIFTPKDYLEEWITGQRLWNEQYLLEAFLAYNPEFEIVLSSNLIFHKYKELLLEKCPVLRKELINNPIREVGSFWIKRN
ncbi:MAG: class I SAM-dependent methyltransferase [Melioribacteraceae bacterium]|nr:class I SAM-dependent methyltransferase [Melioribacteraceae bacterium]